LKIPNVNARCALRDSTQTYPLNGFADKHGVTAQAAALPINPGMRLSIKELNHKIIATTFNQRYAARTNMFPCGSRGYSNCTGLCVWNRLGNVGVLAHIEAVDPGDYPTVFDEVCRKISEDINTNGGHRGSFSIVVFGGAATQDYSESFAKSLFDNFGARNRLNYLGILDMRNGEARGLIGRAKPFSSVRYGAAVLDPHSKTLYLEAIGPGTNIHDADKDNDVTVFPIQ